MSETSVQTSPAAPVGVTAEPGLPQAPRPRSRKTLVRRALEGLASLKLTVVLLALAIVLVFCGTLAQVYHGIWVVVKLYFQAFYVWIPFQIFFPRDVQLPKIFGVALGFPFPGGSTLGALLLVNLLAAHVTRFKIAWRRTGILLIHAGLIVLMMSQLITWLFAVEGNMPIATGASTNYVERNDHMELAVVEPIDKEKEGVTSVPSSILRKGGLIRNKDLPFDVRVVQYMPNTKDVVTPPAGAVNPATAGLGMQYLALEQPEGVGVDSDAKYDAPSAYIELKPKDGGSLGVYLVSAMIRDAQPVKVGDKTYEVSLRPHRDYKPYTVQLLKFTHSVYPGTQIDKDFRSRVLVTGPGETRETDIYMNAPMRYQGETFYQAGTLGGDSGTVLQVVHNPGALLPYIACAMVIVGLLIHFGISLLKFLKVDPSRIFSVLGSLFGVRRAPRGGQAT